MKNALIRERFNKLVVLGKLQKLGLLGLKRTVGFSGSAVAGIRAGELGSSR